MSAETDLEGLAWQIGIWDRIAPIYLREIDPRFAPVIDGVLTRAALLPGQQVLDVGTGTGTLAVHAAPRVAPGGHVLAIDVSAEMLALARGRVAALGLTNVGVREGRAEAIPAGDDSSDVVLASLSLMYVIDRSAAACEIARVLRPGGRFVAAVWAGPEQCDIVLFQQTAGRFAPGPPVPGVGPGVLADPSPFLALLADAGIAAHVETETLGFDFDNFAAAWDVLAGVTASQLGPERQHVARGATMAAMWPNADGPRHFRNVTQFIVGERS